MSYFTIYFCPFILIRPAVYIEIAGQTFKQT